MVNGHYKRGSKHDFLTLKTSKMRQKRKIKREMMDSIYIYKAARLGDLQAIKIYNIIVAINKEEEDLKKNIRTYSTGVRLHIINTIFALKKERDHLLYRFNLDYKKARVYLDDLKQQKREERKQRTVSEANTYNIK
jgi:hypothetical protein